MSAKAIHLHIARLVVDAGFDRAGFERALSQSFSQPASGEWASRAVDGLRLDYGAKDSSAAGAGRAVAEGVRSLAGAPAAETGGGRHGGQ